MTAKQAVQVTMADGQATLALAGDAVGSPGDPAVLFFHGGGQTRHAWGTAVQTLAGQHWHAQTFDLPGHGDSGWVTDGIYELNVFARAVAAAAAVPARPVLVGASLGGISSLVAIAEGLVPHAAALVLVDVTPTLEQAGVDRITDFMRLGVDGFDSLDDVAEAIATYLPNRRRPSDLSGLSKNVRRRADGRWVWHWDPRFIARIDSPTGEPTAGRLTPPERLRAACQAISIPTLLVRGGSSDVVSADGAAELQRLIPHAEVTDVAGAGHMVAGDRNDRFNEAIIEFLERVVRPDTA
jgi:pimeloyl-ACP methyl ester carboxylesterase